MQTRILTLLLCSLSAASQAADTQCLQKKYDAYIDASLNWYQDLIQLTTSQHPDLAEAGQWFYQGREYHFELNRTAVHHYLQKNPSKVATELSVESWLQLEQSEVKQLTSRNDALGQIASQSFNYRQSKPHPKNYQLRSAFAELLSHPDKIDTVLSRYNNAVSRAESIVCN